ncbi:MAG: TubC N-terminal docking domain-related protein [Candidatus Geothermincolia bacterium]
MNAALLLEELTAADVVLHRAGNMLKHTAPEGVLTPNIMASLRLRKADILQLLEVALVGKSNGSEDKGYAPKSHSCIAAVLASELLRCADCRHVHYRSAPLVRRKGLTTLTEWLECEHDLEVTLRELGVPSRYCKLFN